MVKCVGLYYSVSIKVLVLCLKFCSSNLDGQHLCPLSVYTATIQAKNQIGCLCVAKCEHILPLLVLLLIAENVTKTTN